MERCHWPAEEQIQWKVAVMCIHIYAVIIGYGTQKETGHGTVPRTWPWSEPQTSTRPCKRVELNLFMPVNLDLSLYALSIVLGPFVCVINGNILYIY